MRHRVFVAINLDEKTIIEIAELIDECRKKLPRGIENQIRFLPPENWHITLSFLGYQDEADIEKIKAVLEETAKGYPSTSSGNNLFEVRFERIIWGPLERTPRMIWLLGDGSTSKKLGEIKNRLEDILETNDVPFDRETRPLNAHITLARFDMRLPQPKPEIEKAVELRFEAKSLDLMESQLSRGGAQYTILQKFPLTIKEKE